MDIPADWLSEAALTQGLGVAESDRSKFHRNLQNWRQSGLLLVPMIRYHGVGIGNEPFYPPVTIEMIRRLEELREQYPRNMDEWLWELWLDGYPVDVIAWCRRRLRKLADAVRDEPGLDIEATRKPIKRLDPRRLIYRVLGRTSGWYALMAWAVAVAIGSRPAVSLFDKASSPLVMLTGKIDITAAAVVNNMGIGDLLAVLDKADETEIERAREDCRVIAHASNVKNLARLVLTAMWRRMDARAIFLPGLIALRRSPGHQGSLVEVLGETEPSQRASSSSNTEN
jgi:hypothetical protein